MVAVSVEYISIGLSLFILFLLLDNPIWEIWENGFSSSIRVKPSSTQASAESAQLRHANPLQSFAYRGYHSEFVSCSNIHRLSASVELQCDGMNKTTRQGKHSCGDVPLIPGLCIMPEKVKYVLDPVRTHERQVIPYCIVKHDEFNTSTDFELGYFSSAGIYHSAPGNCELKDVNPVWMHQWFKGKRIVFIGDSHARNLFTAFVAEVRNQKFVLERHTDQFTKYNLSPYQVFNFNAESDHLEDFTGGAETIGAHLKVCDVDLSCCDVQVIFLWAGFPKAYEKVLATTMVKIKPEIIITDFLSKAYTSAENFDASVESTTKAFETYFAENTVRNFVVSPFPINGGESIIERVRLWLNDKRDAEWASRALLLHQEQFIASFRRTGTSMSQLAHLSHTVCSLFETYSLEPEKRKADVGGTKIAGYESCTAPVDRAIVRAALTFSYLSGGKE